MVCRIIAQLAIPPPPFPSPPPPPNLLHQVGVSAFKWAIIKVNVYFLALRGQRSIQMIFIVQCHYIQKLLFCNCINSHAYMKIKHKIFNYDQDSLFKTRSTWKSSSIRSRRIYADNNFVHTIRYFQWLINSIVYFHSYQNLNDNHNY